MAALFCELEDDMETNIETQAAEAPPASTAGTLVFLAAFSIIASWLLCYGVVNVLISSNLMNPLPPGEDPRPAWMLRVFSSAYGGFILLALFFRWLSNRQLMSIDHIADE
jgi:hypothetical protein